MSKQLNFRDIVRMKNKPNLKPYIKTSNILKVPQVKLPNFRLPDIPKAPTLRIKPKKVVKSLKTGRRKRELTPVEKAYNKAYSQLKSAITRVEKEGFEAYTQLPKKVKNPTLKTIGKMEALKALVLEQSFKVDDKGNKISRLSYQNEQRKIKREVKKLHKDLLQGEKVLTKDMQRKYLSDIKSVLKNDLYGKDLADLRGILETIMESFFILLGENYNNPDKWVSEFQNHLVNWFSNATPETIEAARDKIDWKKFMIQFYDSEGPGRGLQPFFESIDKELAKLESIVYTDTGSYESLSYADKLGAGLL